MTSLITSQNGYCEKCLQQKLCPYRTGPVYYETYRDRVGSEHYCGHHLGGEWKTLRYTISVKWNMIDNSLYSQQNHCYRYCQR
jgi:hypothetical protein